MSLVEWLTPTVTGLEVPPGDPDALRGAARTFEGAAEGLEAGAARIENTLAAVTSNLWFGIAALAFSASCSQAASDCRTGSGSFRSAVGALNSLASELAAAQELAKRALAQAADLNDRSARLDAAYADAAAAEAAAGPKGLDGPSPIPSLVVQAGALQFAALGVRAQAAAAAEQARLAAARASGVFDRVTAQTPSVRRAAEARARAAAAAKAEEDRPWYEDIGHAALGAGDWLLDRGGDVVDAGGAAVDWAWDAGGDAAGWVWDKGGDVISGAWDGIKEPVVMLYHLTPFHDGWTEEWKNLGSGLWYGVTHPIEFGKAIIGVDVWREKGFAYWAGNLVPGAVAAVATGGAGAAVRGTSATARVVENTEDVLDAASDARGVTRVAGGLDDGLANSRRIQDAFDDPDHEWQYDVLRPGPLTPEGSSLDDLRRSAAQTFASGKYDIVSFDEPYVVFKAGAHPGGRFFSFDPPASEAAVRIDNAVKPQWLAPDGSFQGSSLIERGYAFVVDRPQHPVAIGPISDQGGIYLGGRDRIQILISDRERAGLRLVEDWEINDPPQWVRELVGNGR